MTSAAIIRQQALARAAAGDDAGAARLFAQGLAAFPQDAAFANSAGSFHNTAGRAAEALALFDQALAIQPAYPEAAINRAVVLPKLGRAREAAAYLRERERQLAAVARYWTTRAAAELASGDPAAAAASYDQAIARQPDNARALSGRAWTSLERGEDRAVADHEQALRRTPGDPVLLLGLTRALRSVGRESAAWGLAEAVSQQLPGWTDGHEAFADLRWSRGDTDRFTDHYAAAARAAPSPQLFLSWASMLSGVDRHSDAARVLGNARRLWPDDRALALALAIAAGEAGEVRTSESILATDSADPDWLIAKARLRLQTQDPAAAEALLAMAITADPANVTAWSLRDVAWRLLGDTRHEWLHGRRGVIREIELDISPKDLDELRSVLNALHDRSAMPIGQSVKHGSQTRGALFHRPDAIVARAATAVQHALEQYRADLPAADTDHPLLRHRDMSWRVTGSWSIRLRGTGHHAAHVHPYGVLSSAAYVTVPDVVRGEDRQGWLELGRPPGNLGSDLQPLRVIEPQEGHCALFPSTLFHGTRPIASGCRMTIAFDVAPV